MARLLNTPEKCGLPPALPEDVLIRMKGKKEENTSALTRRTVGLKKFSYSRLNLPTMMQINTFFI